MLIFSPKSIDLLTYEGHDPCVHDTVPHMGSQ